MAALTMCAFGLRLWAALAILSAAATVLIIFVRKSAIPVVLALILASLAAVRFVHTGRQAQALWEKYDSVEATVSGEVYEPPSYNGYTGVYVLKTRLGLVELVCYRENIVECEVGDRLTVNARLSAPEPIANDYGFDSRKYALSRGILLNAEGGGQPKVTKGRGGLRRLAAKVRDQALSTGEKRLFGAARELYPAIVLGDRSQLSASLKKDLSSAGLSHIAAVSGLHLSVLSVILMFLLTIPFGRRRFARLLIIPPLIFFAFVTGCQPSVVRACIMCVIFQLSMVLYRESDGLSSLAAAFTAMTLWSPMLIYSTGFQLSVASTLGILLFCRPLMKPATRLLSAELFDQGRISRFVAKILRGAAAITSVSLSAQIASFPISAGTFNYIPVYALPANLLTIPLMTPVMAVGLALAVFGRIPFLGGVIARAAELLMEYIALVVRSFAALPHATIPVMEIPFLLVAAYYALLLSLFALYSKKKLLSAALGLVFAVTSITGFLGVSAKNGVRELCFLNVGRGDCALFRAEGTSVLIDGGRGGSAVSDYLDARGLFKLDCAVLTSTSMDHIYGLIDLVDGGYVERLYVPSGLEQSDRLETLLLSAEAAKVPVQEYVKGGSVYVGGLTLRAIDSDSDSVQLMAEYDGRKILFCGGSVMDWEDCDIVKLPGHGSGSYNYYPELHRHTPEYAVMTASGSAAAARSKMFPVLDELDIPLYVPADDGTVTFTLDGELEVRTTHENTTLSQK